VLLLNLWAEGRRVMGTDMETAGGRFMFVKLAFSAAFDPYITKVRALDRTFFRERCGPVSKAICAAWDALAWLGVMAEDGGFGVTARSTELAMGTSNGVLEFGPNEPIRSIFWRMTERWARWLPMR
jgi:hypothetical protein